MSTSRWAAATSKASLRTRTRAGQIGEAMAGQISAESVFRRPPPKSFGAFCLDVRTLFFLPTSGFTLKLLEVIFFAGEQKTTKKGLALGSGKSRPVSE